MGAALKGWLVIASGAGLILLGLIAYVQISAHQEATVTLNEIKSAQGVTLEACETLVSDAASLDDLALAITNLEIAANIDNRSSSTFLLDYARDRAFLRALTNTQDSLNEALEGNESARAEASKALYPILIEAEVRRQVSGARASAFCESLVAESKQ